MLVFSFVALLEGGFLEDILSEFKETLESYDIRARFNLLSLNSDFYIDKKDELRDLESSLSL